MMSAGVHGTVVCVYFRGSQITSKLSVTTVISSHPRRRKLVLIGHVHRKFDL